MSSAHVVRVQRLYRASLKNMLHWAIHRRLWIKKANDIRAEFEANRHLDSARQIEKILTAGEARLAEYKHPDPYKLPTDFGGSKYMRYANNGAGFDKDVCAIPNWIK
mmetsp:Transcript_2398/g.7668  ORF Transcript_2398/g.7668 Transcript_2398/m.7668 type:complete len:107 (+) Transcript_2398:47-367(+)